MIESAWLRIGPTLARPATSCVDAEEAGDAAGRRCVEHDGVVDAAAFAAGVLAAYGLVDLAGEQDVAHARRDRRGEVDGADAPQRATGPAELVEHVEVLEQRLLGVDREGEHVAAAGADRDLALLVGQRRRVEELRDALPVLDLDEQRAATLPGQRQRERGRDRGLAGAALAGHDMQAHALPVGLVRLPARHAASVTAGPYAAAGDPTRAAHRPAGARPADHGRRARAARRRGLRPAAGRGLPARRHASTRCGCGSSTAGPTTAAGSSPWPRTAGSSATAGRTGRSTTTGRVEIGYGLAAPFRGRGFGTELVGALVGLAGGAAVGPGRHGVGRGRQRAVAPAARPARLRADR